MGDPISVLTDVVANVATGGLYGLAKGVQKTVETGSPSALLSQGLDLGMAATGNTAATDVGGPMAGSLYNAAGGLAGAAGGAGAFASGAPEVGSVSAGAAAPTVAGQEAATGLTTEPIISGGDVATEGAMADMGGPVPVSEGATPFPDEATAAPSASSDVSAPASTAPAEATPPAAGGSQVPSSSSLLNTESLGQLRNVQPNLLNTAESTKSWFDGLSPIAQVGLVMAGPQLLTGAAGGLFNGLNAQQRLNLETLINQQNQNQRQYLNKNNAFAPSVSFPKTPTPGLIAAAGGK